MKSLPLRIPVLLLAGLLFTGCYTKFNATSQDDHTQKMQAVHVEDGWFDVDGNYFYIDYATREWYSYWGIDLTTDKRFLRAAQFSYRHPSSTYFYSPFRSFYFYNFPGYASTSFFRTGLWNPRHGFFGFHPPFYSNPYMYSFYYNRWQHWLHWQSAHTNYWGSSFTHSTSGSPASRVGARSTGLRSGGSDIHRRSETDRVHSSRLAADRDDLFAVTSRERVNVRSVEPITLNDRQRNLRDRRDSEYRTRLERNRAVRSPLSSWSSWEQRNNNRSGISVGARSNSRSSATVNRSNTSRTSGSSAVRGSSNRGSSSGSVTRSSGSSNRSSGSSSSSSRGSN